jgi:hypothetical protein
MRSPWKYIQNQQPTNSQVVWVRNGFLTSPPTLGQVVGSFAGWALQRLDVVGGSVLAQDNMIWLDWWPGTQWRPSGLADVTAWTGILDGYPSDGQTVWAFMPFVRAIATPLIWHNPPGEWSNDADDIPRISWADVSYWLPR